MQSKATRKPPRIQGNGSIQPDILTGQGPPPGAGRPSVLNFTLSKLTSKNGLQNGRIKREKRAAYITYMCHGTYTQINASQTSQGNTEDISRERKGAYSTRVNRTGENSRMDHPGFIEAVRKRREIAITAWITPDSLNPEGTPRNGKGPHGSPTLFEAANKR